MKEVNEVRKPNEKVETKINDKNKVGQRMFMKHRTNGWNILRNC